MKVFTLHSEILLPRPVEEVFAFFADARNLGRLTPSWLRFEVLTPAPIAMRPGTVIDYRLRIRGIPIRWQSEITVWEPPHSFVDEQRRGPYWQWIHEHRFSKSGANTVAEDHIRYAVPGGAIANKLFVARDLKRIFAYRVRELARIFGAAPDPPPDISTEHPARGAPQ